MTHDSLAFTSVKPAPTGDAQTRDFAAPTQTGNANVAQSGDTSADTPQSFHSVMAEENAISEPDTATADDLEVQLTQELGTTEEIEGAETETNGSESETEIQPRIMPNAQIAENAENAEDMRASTTAEDATSPETDASTASTDAEKNTTQKQVAEVTSRIAPSMGATVFAAQVAESKKTGNATSEQVVTSKIAPQITQSQPSTDAAAPTIQAQATEDMKPKLGKKLPRDVLEMRPTTEVANATNDYVLKQGVVQIEKMRTALLQQTISSDGKSLEIKGKDSDRSTAHGIETSSHGQLQQASRQSITTPTPSFSDVHRAMGQQTVQQISAAITPIKPGTTDISLAPAELGKLRITVSGNEQSMLVTVAAERPETADLLRRNLEMLSDALRSESNADINFAFAEHEFTGQSDNNTDENSQSGSSSGTSNSEGGAMQTKNIVNISTGRHMLSSNLDLRL